MRLYKCRQSMRLASQLLGSNSRRTCVSFPHVATLLPAYMRMNIVTHRLESLAAVTIASSTLSSLKYVPSDCCCEMSTSETKSISDWLINLMEEYQWLKGTLLAT